MPPRAPPLGTRRAVLIFHPPAVPWSGPPGVSPSFPACSRPPVLCSSAQPQPPSPLAFISLLVSPLPGGAQRAERFASTRLPPRLALLPWGFRLIWRRNRRRNHSQPPPVCKHLPCALFCEKKNSLLTVELGASRPPCRERGAWAEHPKGSQFFGGMARC